MAEQPTAKILFLADTHLGFDYPFRPRIERRRRGPDFFANFERALEPALEGGVALVVHGGDILYRSKVPARLVAMAFEPLFRVADGGVPVYVVPGNHERGSIPYPMLARHSGVHVFDRPRTYTLDVSGFSLALSGFPYDRGGVRKNFLINVDKTGWLDADADARLLCMHHIVGGAQVGPKDFTFRSAPDVIRGRDIPSGFAAVFSGHIHRHQILRHDLAGRELAAPVLYPGSVERTSFAEKDEGKGYMIVEAGPSKREGGAVYDLNFVKLPTRPMIDVKVEVDGLGPDALRRRMKKLLASVDPNGIVRLRVQGKVLPEARQAFSSESLREAAPATMNVSLANARKFWGADEGRR